MLGRKSAARRGRSTSALLCLGGILAALAPAWGERVDPALHWPAPPAEVERLLAEVPFRIVSVRGDVGGVMGVGMARGMEAVNFRVILKIILFWVLTVPAAALTSMAVFKILQIWL